MGRTVSSSHARLICLPVCLSLLTQPLLPAYAGAAGRGTGKAAPTAVKPTGRQEVEAAGLPDLDASRRRPRREPKAVPPVPSTRRRCPPRNPRCNDGAGDSPQATPTPAVSPSPAGYGEPHSLASASARPFAALMGAAFGGGVPSMEVLLLDFYSGGGYSVSDSPARPKLADALAAAPAPEPFALYQGQQGRVNVAAASSGATASGSTSYDSFGLHASNAINGIRTNSGSYWNDQTSGGFPDHLEVVFAGVKTIDEIDLFFLQDNYGTAEPTEGMTFTQFGVTSFEVQYWTGAAWAAVPNGTVTGNNKVWRKFTFSPLATSKIRLQVNGATDMWSRVVEVEAYESAPNIAAASAGATATASTSYSAYGMTPARAINGVRTNAGSYWNDQTSGAFADEWLQVNFGGAKSLGEVDVYFLQDNYGTAEPTESMTFTQFGVTSFEVQYSSGGQWVTVPGGNVTGNNRVWRRFAFAPVTTDRIRVLVHNSSDMWSRIVEVEAYESSALPAGTGLTGEYYGGVNFDEYKLTRADAAVNFGWGSGSPHASVGADNFSARWTGTVVPRYSENYTFHTTTDDGVRLWVDGQLVIDRWVDQAPTEWAGQMALQAGRAYAVRMEFYERGGGATGQLRWSSASQAKEVVPQSCLYGCWKGADRFARDFFQGALGRQPSAAESQDWAGRLNQAQGEYQLVAEAQGLGAQVFDSGEYAARNRSDQEYVSDLYRAYMQRAPDAGGLSHWTNQITPCGPNQQCRQVMRADVRRAFDQSAEFTEKVRTLCGTAAGAPAGGGGYNFSTARLDPANRTGGVGVDAYSRNFNFQIPLVSLAGRAGLDLGLTLSYNSLVWTRDSTGVTFDADQGFPSPGFRLGFPTVEPKFVNPRLQQQGQPTRYSYLLVTPSGARVELRQVGASNVYESADSSFLQLIEVGGLTLLSTDGTRLSFTLRNGLYRCDELRDRNGNYLSVTYDGDGRLLKVTDTLGRAVAFKYDSFQNLEKIWQTWKREEVSGSAQDGEHVWATFGYADVTLQPQFADLAVIGEQPGAVLPALNQVGLADGSYYKFSYNQWGQVWKVTRYAADSVGANNLPNDSHPLTATRLDLPGSDLRAAAPQPDCPRFREQRTWVENGVLNQSAEVTTSFDEWSPDMASCEVTLPDGATKQVSTYATSADKWMKGLTTKEEVKSGGQIVKTVTLAWEHDGAGAALYPTNPRVTQTSTSDPEGHARTTRVTYTAPADFQGESGYAGTLNLRLPRKVEEFGADGSTVLRTTVTDYKVPDLSRYVERRILGLARYQSLYEGAEGGPNLRSRVGYFFDDTGHVEGDAGQPKFLQPLDSPAWQHYKDDYGVALRWRGNLTRVRRYELSTQTWAETGSFTESLVGYNVVGAAVFSQDAAGHRTTVGYADAFYANVNRTHADPPLRLQTYAYPTVVTDPEGFSSWTWYNYDMGVATKARSQKPNATTHGTDGPVVSRFYDGAGRVVKTTNSVNAAHAEWVYDPSMTLVESFTTVSDESLHDAGLRLYGATALDGLGRVRGTARDFPGSATASPAGNYSAQLTFHDASGRVVFQSNPTEMRIDNGTWLPAGDDANGGLWRGTAQEYDWKGRPIRTVNPDGSDKLFEYGGCGCAGGEVVTQRGELVPIPGTSSQGRRAQRTYSDVLGRPWKAEVLNWDGSVHSTTTTRFDALDRPLRVREYAGAAPQSEPSGEGAGYQTTTLTYDGYGRLHSRRLPKYEPGTVTSYQYNADDTVRSARDPRGVLATYSYNRRHMLTGVAYDAPSGVADTPDVSFAYDAVGNPKQMTDGTGSVTYDYDPLSRLSKEKRLFNALPGHAYETFYHHTASGQLKYVIDPAGSRVDYSYDRAGMVRGVSGSGPASAPAYVSDMRYRAWGSLKDAEFGNGTHQSVAYDARLRASTMELRNVIPYGANQAPLTMRWDYDYYADGLLNHAYDHSDGRFDRKFDYDDQGRLKEAFSGREARGLAPTQTPDSPFRQTFGYDAWGNMTARSGRFWRQTLPAENGVYANDRRGLWNYDAAGNLTASDNHVYAFDAAGHQTDSHGLLGECGGYEYEIRQEYDGDGRPARRTQTTRTHTGAEPSQPQCATQVEQIFYVYAAGLGGAKLMEVGANGAKVKGYVYGGGMLLAQQDDDSGVKWRHHNPAAAGWVETTDARRFERREMGPLGDDVGTHDPYPLIPDPTYADIHGAGPLFVDGGSPLDLADGCGTIDGMPASCDEIADRMAAGSVTYEVRGRDGRARQLAARGRLAGTGWVDDWVDCAKPGEDVICQRNDGFFVEAPGAGVSLASQLTQQKTISNFNYGKKGVPFKDWERRLLDDALRLINSEKCRTFLDGILAPRFSAYSRSGSNIPPPPSNSASLISMAHVNKYHRGLTAQQMGMSQAERDRITKKDGYLRTFHAVTYRDQVWLNDSAFHPGGLRSRGDLPAIIVHELLHVAGFDDARQFNDQIQQNCGWGGDIGGASK